MANAALPTPDDVRAVLAGVLDPELRASITELDMVREVTVGPDGTVVVHVALTTAACPLRGQIGNDVRSKVAGLPGVAEVTVEYAEGGGHLRPVGIERVLISTQHADDLTQEQIKADLPEHVVKPLLPAEMETLSPTTAYVTITEGRYHQVRRMFAACGFEVVALHRTHVGPYALGDLAATDHQAGLGSYIQKDRVISGHSRS